MAPRMSADTVGAVLRADPSRLLTLLDLAEIGDSPDMVRLALATLASAEVASALRDHERTLSDEVWRTILDKCDRHSLPTVLERKDVPGWAANELADATHPYIRLAVAGHPDLAPDAIDELLGAFFPRLRARAVARRDTPGDVLERMAHDEHSSVVWAVAEHRRVTKAALDVIARRDNVPLREFVALHPKLSAKSAAFLATQEEDVARAVGLRNKLPSGAHKALAQSRYYRVRAIAAARPEPLPPALIDALAKDRDASVQLLVSRRPDITEQAALRLARSKSPEVRRSLADHPQVSEAVQVILALGS